MPTRLTAKAVEESTYIVTASFVNEEGNAITPNELTWTLTDRHRTVINGREDVVITPDTSVDIVLTGDDLVMGDDERATVLTVTIKGTYDSDAGTDLELKDSTTFPIVG